MSCHFRVGIACPVRDTWATNPGLAGLVCHEAPGGRALAGRFRHCCTRGLIVVVDPGFVVDPGCWGTRNQPAEPGSATIMGRAGSTGRARQGRGDRTPAAASMTSRRTGPAGQSCCAPLYRDQGAIHPRAALPGIGADVTVGVSRCTGEPRGRHPRQVNPGVHLVERARLSFSLCHGSGGVRCREGNLFRRCLEQVYL